MSELKFNVPSTKELEEFFEDAYKNVDKAQVEKSFATSKDVSDNIRDGLRTLLYGKGNTLKNPDNQKELKKLIALIERMFDSEMKAIAKVKRSK